MKIRSHAKQFWSQRTRWAKHPGLIPWYLKELLSWPQRTWIGKNITLRKNRLLWGTVHQWAPAWLHNTPALRRGYMRFSTCWWGHPSSGHWGAPRPLLHKKYPPNWDCLPLRHNERCFICGTYSLITNYDELMARGFDPDARLDEERARSRRIWTHSQREPTGTLTSGVSSGPPAGKD